MATKRKFTKTDSSRIRNFFDDLEKLNKYSKINIQNLTDPELEALIGEYPHLLLRDISAIPFRDFANIHYRYLGMMNSDLGAQKVKSALVRVQSCLLERISEVRQSLEKSELSQLLSFTGTVTITFDPATNRYVQTYMPEGFSPELKIDTEMECRIISVKYFEVIAYLCQELPHDRLKVCEKCGTPFFQATVREKIYCSALCSKAVAQAQYIQRKVQGGDYNKK